MPESDGGKEHIAELQPDKSHDKGCVTKHEDGFIKPKPKHPKCAYRVQGYNTITADSKKRKLYEINFTGVKAGARLPYIYEEFKIGSATGKSDPKNYRFADDPVADKKTWHFGKGEGGNNFKVAYLPYNHNYHHILPFECLKPLSYPELKLLQEAGYNLNAGINLIILPCLDRYGYALMLPAHPYNHDKYSEDVKTVVNRVKQKVAAKKRGHKLDKKNVKKFKTELERWEKDEFWVIVDYGKSQAKDKRHAMINDTPVASRRTRKGFQV